MAFQNAWVETDPDGNVIFVSQLDDAERTTKKAIRERLEGDPAVPDLTGLIEAGSFTSAPKPRKGAARVYVDTEANILAFGATKREDGRLAVSSDSKRLFHVATAGVVELDYLPKTGGSLSGTLTINPGKVIVNQGGADDGILELRSTDVNHGMTGEANNQCYGFFKKNSVNVGGLVMIGLADAGATVGINVSGYTTSTESTRSINAAGSIMLIGAKRSGTTAQDMGANQNIVVVRDFQTARFILDSDGSSHQDVGTAWTNFDDQDDVILLNKLAAHVTRQNDPLRKGFRDWLLHNRGELEEMKLVTFNEDGHHFVNMSRLTMLHTGALRQLGARVGRLEELLLTGGRDENPQLQRG
jgi:hypothetical protein